MFEVWKLNRQLRKIRRTTAEEREKLDQRKASPEDYQLLDFQESDARREVEQSIDFIVGVELVHEARSLDVELPPFGNPEMWFLDEENSRIYLTSKGRAHVRKMIDEEKARRFEVWAKWVKLLTPIVLGVVTAIVGIIGALTGLFAVLQHKK